MAGPNKDEPMPCFQEHDNSQPQTEKNDEENPNQNGPDNTEILNLTDPDNTVNGAEEEEPEEAVVLLEQETLEANSSISSGMLSQLTDVSTHTISRRCSKKRKKGKGKGRLNGKKQQMLEKKIQSLTENLNPIPFMPLKTLDFPKHETLLRKLGLWDFIKIDFDKKPNKDLIVQLVANYESRYSNVNGSRFGVNRAHLARAFKMPAKKEKGNAGVDLDVEPLCKDSIAFMEEFVLNWMLLHDDMWMMPNEVMNWLKMIKEGHPDKIDWAGLIWFMMEKELVQGEKLKNCYYAAHLQHLMKEQKVFLKEEELDPVVKEVEVEDICEGDANVDEITKREDGPSIELTLGQDAEKELKVEDMEMVGSENGKDSDEEDGSGEEQGQWLMERCNNAENNREIELELDEEKAVEEKFHNFVNDDDSFDENGLSDNFLEAMNEDQIGFTSHLGPLEIRMDSHPSVFNQDGKRVIQQDDLISNRNKRLRMNDSCENNNGPADFGMCMENFQKSLSSLHMFHEQKQREIEASESATQMLLDELQKRDSMIEHLKNTRYQEVQKKDEKIHGYEKELFMMGNVLDGYRKAVKAVQKEFAEYREKVGLPEEAAYKVAGTGGLMLSVGEIERNRKKQEDEYRNNCLVFELKVQEMEEHFAGQFDLFFEKVNMLDGKLAGLEVNAKELIGLSAERKVPRIEDPEISKAPLDDIVECSADEIEERSAGENLEVKSDGTAEVLCDEIAKHPTNEVEEDNADGTFDYRADEETGTDV